MQLITRQFLRACWYLRTFRCISEDFPENMGPSMSYMCPVFFIRLNRQCLFNLKVKLKAVNSQYHFCHMSEQIQISVQAESELQSDSYKLKLNFIERSLQKAKSQNVKLVQKIEKLQKQNQTLKRQNKSNEERVTKINDQLKKKEKEIQSLAQKLEIRTKRHESEQSQNLSRSDKQQLQRKMKRAEQYAMLCKAQKESQTQKCKSLMWEIQELSRQKVGLIAKIQYLQGQIVQDSKRIKNLEVLYQEKIKIFQSQKVQLKKQNESLILQVKLIQRKKQIQGLLNYENKIGNDTYIKSSSLEMPTYRTSQQRSSQGGDLYCCCQSLQQQLWQAEQLISLIKQRNIRLVSEIQALKKRCSVLQGIICNSSG